MENAKLPAYPLVKIDEDGRPYFDKRDSGLTKLEAFTMAAMQGLCSMENKSDQVFSSIEEAYATIANIAVGIARATLSELSKQQS